MVIIGFNLKKISKARVESVNCGLSVKRILWGGTIYVIMDICFKGVGYICHAKP